MTRNTIYALSTVYGKSGVAVIRISGNKVLDIISQITSIDINTITPRHTYFTNIINPKTKDILDNYNLKSNGDSIVNYSNKLDGITTMNSENHIGDIYEMKTKEAQL